MFSEARPNAVSVIQRGDITAASRAARTNGIFADARFTLVAPRFPQAPAQGLKISGAFLTNFVCCSGLNLTMP